MFQVCQGDTVQGLWAAGGKHLPRGQMITSQEGTARPSDSSKNQGKAPGSWSQHYWDYLLLPQLGCTLPHSCLFLPCSWGEIPLRRPLGCSALTFLKPPFLSFTVSLHSAGTGLAVACADSWGTSNPGSLVSGLEHCIAVWGGTGTLPCSGQIPSPGEIVVSMAMHSVTTSLSAGS